MNKNVLIKLMIGLLICIVIIISILIVFLKRGTTQTNESATLNTEEQDVEEKHSSQWEYLNDINTFSIIENCLQTYISNMSVDELNVENVNMVDVIATNIKVSQNSSDFASFLVNGLIVDKYANKSTQRYFLIKLDFNTKYFSVTPLESENDDINTENDIKQDDNNKFEMKSMDDKEIAQKYFKHYQYQLLYNPKYLYTLLDEEYKAIRFGNSYEKFIEYVDSVKDMVGNAILSKYSVNYSGDKIIYILMDSSNSYYTIMPIAAMVYTIQLDNYTIETDTFVEKYNKATDVQKVGTNIEKFFKMLNTKDYEGAYNMLGTSFKENYFTTIEDFKNYAKKNFFEYTIINETKEIQQSGEYYACTVETKTGDTVSAKRGKETFIVALGEGTKCEISFTVKK